MGGGGGIVYVLRGRGSLMCVCVHTCVHICNVSLWRHGGVCMMMHCDTASSSSKFNSIQFFKGNIYIYIKLIPFNTNNI